MREIASVVNSSKSPFLDYTLIFPAQESKQQVQLQDFARKVSGRQTWTKDNGKDPKSNSPFSRLGALLFSHFKKRLDIRLVQCKPITFPPASISQSSSLTPPRYQRQQSPCNTHFQYQSTKPPSLITHAMWPVSRIWVLVRSNRCTGCSWLLVLITWSGRWNRGLVSAGEGENGFSPSIDFACIGCWSSMGVKWWRMGKLACRASNHSLWANKASNYPQRNWDVEVRRVEVSGMRWYFRW